MCGIGGFSSNLNNLQIFEENLERVAQSMHHRGPDAKSTWLSDNKNVGFCHTRLSIIDINNRANQPMHSIDERFVLVFNGEIYNYKELKNQLLFKGCKFLTESDSEVIIEGFRIWGEEVLSKLEGMFSFAIFDKKENLLFIARDHIGKKPLHYTLIKNNFIFAS